MDRKPNLLACVYHVSRPALPVWIALSMLAKVKGRRSFRIRRSELGRICGIERVATISRALSALQTLGLIARKVRYGRRPDGRAYTKLSITLKQQVQLCAKCGQTLVPQLMARKAVTRRTVCITAYQKTHDLPKEDSAECAHNSARAFSTLEIADSSLRAALSACASASLAPAATPPTAEQLNPTTPQASNPAPRDASPRAATQAPGARANCSPATGERGAGADGLGLVDKVDRS